MRALPVMVLMAVMTGCAQPVGGPELFAGEVVGTQLAVADGFVYWTTRDQEDLVVWRMPTTGGDAEEVSRGAAAAELPGMAVGDGEVYWATRRLAQDDFAELFAAPVGGGAPRMLTSFRASFFRAGGLAVDDHAVYVGSDLGPLAVPLDGTPPVRLVEFGVNTEWLALRGTRLYHRGAPNQVAVIDTADGDAAVLTAALGSRFAVDDTQLYTAINASIIVVPLDGGPTTPLPVGNGPADIVRGPDALYAADGSAVYRVPLDGATPTVLTSNRRVLTLARDDAALYYAESAAGGHGSIGRLPF